MRGLWLRGNTWWLDAKFPERTRTRISLETSDPVEAMRKAQEIRKCPARFLDKEDASLVDLYLAHQERRGISRARIELSRMILKEVTKVAGGKIQDLSPVLAGRWWNGLLARIAPKSCKDYLGVANVFFKWCIDAGHVTASPVALIIPPKLRPTPRKVFLRPEEALRVLDTAEGEDLRFAIYCGLHCGLRRGEIIAARPHWFDLEKGLLHVQNEVDWLVKDRSNRTIPITTEFMGFLKIYGIRSPYMLRPDVAPKPTNRHWRYRTDFIKTYNGHMDRLGLGHVTFHDLRRTFASLHVSRGTPLYHVGKWLGDHPNVVESTYGHLLPNDARINDPWTQARAAV